MEDVEDVEDELVDDLVASAGGECGCTTGRAGVRGVSADIGQHGRAGDRTWTRRGSMSSFVRCSPVFIPVQ